MGWVFVDSAKTRWFVNVVEDAPCIMSTLMQKAFLILQQYDS